MKTGMKILVLTSVMGCFAIPVARAQDINQEKIPALAEIVAESGDAISEEGFATKLQKYSFHNIQIVAKELSEYEAKLKTESNAAPSHRELNDFRKSVPENELKRLLALANAELSKKNPRWNILIYMTDSIHRCQESPQVVSDMERIVEQPFSDSTAREQQGCLTTVTCILAQQGSARAMRILKRLVGLNEESAETFYPVTATTDLDERSTTLTNIAYYAALAVYEFAPTNKVPGFFANIKAAEKRNKLYIGVQLDNFVDQEAKAKK